MGITGFAAPTHTVSRLAGLARVSADTVRYYERERLLPPAARTPAGDCPPPTPGTWCRPNPERGCPDVRRQLLRRIVRLRQRLLLSARRTGCSVKDQLKVHAPGDPDVESNSIEHSSRPPLR